jgi:hypothetical protein
MPAFKAGIRLAAKNLLQFFRDDREKLNLCRAQDDIFLVVENSNRETGS